MQYGFVAAHLGIESVDLTCEALGIACTRGYAWLARLLRAGPARIHAGQAVRRSFEAGDCTDGVRRGWREVLATGFGRPPPNTRRMC